MTPSPVDQMKADAKRAEFRLKRIHEVGLDPNRPLTRLKAPSGRCKAITPKLKEPPFKKIPKVARGPIADQHKLVAERRRLIAELRKQGFTIEGIGARAPGLGQQP